MNDLSDLYSYRNFGDRDLADEMNESQLSESDALANAMRKTLDTIIESLPEKLAEVNDLMDAMPNLKLEMVDTRRVGDGAYEIVTSSTVWTGKVWRQYFRIQYAGHKAPAYYDIFVPGMAAWGGGLTLMYSGLVAAEHIARDLAIFTHGMQVPNSVMCRY